MPAIYAASTDTIERQQQSSMSTKLVTQESQKAKSVQKKLQEAQHTQPKDDEQDVAALESEQKAEDRSFFGLKMVQFVEILACVLSEIVEAGDAVPLHPNRQIVSVFHTNKPPQISIDKYLERIVNYAYCSPECFILSLVYLDRIVQRNPKFYISSFNIHRLLITRYVHS
jgi:hypothetical protein